MIAVCPEIAAAVFVEVEAHAIRVELEWSATFATGSGQSVSRGIAHGQQHLAGRRHRMGAARSDLWPRSSAYHESLRESSLLVLEDVTMVGAPVLRSPAEGASPTQPQRVSCLAAEAAPDQTTLLLRAAWNFITAELSRCGQLPQKGSRMPHSVEAINKQRGLLAAAPVSVMALGAVAVIAGATVVSLRQQRKHVVFANCVAPIRHQRADTANLNEISCSVPQSHAISAWIEGRHSDSRRRFNLKRVLAPQPVLAMAAAAIVVALASAAVAVFVAAAGNRGPTATVPWAAPVPAMPSPPEQSPAQLIPAAQGGEACLDDCVSAAGQRFTLDFGKPWLVTQLGFRPLELVPGRRVTRVRWELRDPGHKAEGGAFRFTQTEDAGDGHSIALLHLDGAAGYRTWEITAVVEATVAAPDARLSDSSARSPLVAYGYPAENSAAGTPYPL